MYCDWIGWCGLLPAEQAAWLQAFGSVAAVFLTLSFWMVDRHKSRTAHRAKELAAALVIRPPLQDWTRQISAFITAMTPTDNAETLYWLVFSQDQHSLRAPSELRTMADIFGDLGKSGGEIAELIAYVDDLDSWRASIVRGDPTREAGLGATMDELERDAKALISEVEEARSSAYRIERNVRKVLLPDIHPRRPHRL